MQTINFILNYQEAKPKLYINKLKNILFFTKKVLKSFYIFYFLYFIFYFIYFFIITKILLYLLILRIKIHIIKLFNYL